MSTSRVRVGGGTRRRGTGRDRGILRCGPQVLTEASGCRPGTARTSIAQDRRRAAAGRRAPRAPRPASGPRRDRARIRRRPPGRRCRSRWSTSEGTAASVRSTAAEVTGRARASRVRPAARPSMPPARGRPNGHRDSTRLPVCPRPAERGRPRRPRRSGSASATDCRAWSEQAPEQRTPNLRANGRSRRGSSRSPGASARARIP